MRSGTPRRKPSMGPRGGARLVAMGMLVACSASPSLADESGVSFWQPGAYDSLSATPNQPGWSLSTVSYHGAAYAGSSVSAARLIRIGLIDQTAAANLSATSENFNNTITISPSYRFSEPLLGAAAVVGASTIVGKSSVFEFGSLSALARQFGIGDSVTGFGDLSPQATLYWTRGEHNFMAYATGDIPVGNYKSNRLANLGIGHGAIDAGGGYTYLNHSAGVEFSAVAGFTYNFRNTYTDYKTGVDFHLDMGASKYLTDALFVGPVGYLYQEVGCDSGSGDKFGCFTSRVAGLGAEIGYTAPFQGMQAYVNLKGYGEFAAENRPGGWNVRLTIAFSPK